MTSADRMVIVFALTVLMALYAVLWHPATDGSLVTIRSANQTIQTISLDQPQVLHIHGTLGDSVLEIKDHQIRFLSSPCNNKLCILHGWMQHAGDMMACVPNQVIVEVLGKDKRFDAISF